jgi:hypothetical protein
MSKNHNISSVSTIMVLIAVTITMVSAITLSNHIVLAQNQKFNAKLSGQQEVPPVQTTTASGMAWFKPMQDKVWFKLNVTDMQGVTQAHIHTGKQGENGPILVTLYKSNTPQPINGKLAYGNITANLLEGPMKGKQISDLTTAMSNGSTYVNVHTEKYPKGEIRGQIMMANSTSDKMMKMDK